MRDRFDRRIDYLRISVTDRCNLRCVYCRPETGVRLFDRDQVLSLEEIFEVARVAVGRGMTKLRLTGGEPLVRKGILGLVERLAGLPGLVDLGMTTNGTLLERFAHDLKKAGLPRVNISLDTMDPERYRAVTRNGDIEKVLAGIEAARAAGLSPIKLNCVVQRSSDEPDAQAVRRFAQDNGLEVRFIRQMNLATGEFWVVEGGTGGDCGRCGRLRLTSTGDLLPCLFSDRAFNVRELGVERALDMAVENKPRSGHQARNHQFYSVGG